MAANSKAFANCFTRLFANHSGITGNLREEYPASVSSFITSASRRKAAYCSSSTYDKNIDDQVCPTVVPDYAISGGRYWGPHPVTGVFGPVDSDSDVCSPGHFRLVPSSSASGSTSSSVLDQTVWVRSLDDFEV